MRVLALYDIHGNDAAGAGARMVTARWPDERSIGASLIDPVDPIELTRIFEEIARAQGV
jgi:hypothetical protein